jgi:hypothetical protein
MNTMMISVQMDVSFGSRKVMLRVTAAAFLVRACLIDF